MKNDLERLQFLTRNFNLLQGYPIALAGLLFILEGASVMIWGFPATELIYGWLFLPNLALLVIVTRIAQRRYQRKFGMVRAPMGRRRGLTLAAVAVFYFVLIRLAGPDFKNLGVPLAPTVLNGGLMLLLAGLLPGFPWRHYAAFGALLMAIAFLPAFHIVSKEQFWHGWSLMVPGVALLLCGAIDRLIFLRNLRSLPVEEIHA